jgi:hypothetical protein
MRCGQGEFVPAAGRSFATAQMIQGQGIVSEPKIP